MFGSTSTWGQQNNQNQQQQQQQQPQQGGGLFGGGGFGQQSTGGFGQNTNTGGFGQPAQPQGGGLFGGGASTNTGFGGFGATQAQQQPQQNNAFGAARPTFGASGSTFGQPAPSGGGLFGSGNTNTGFGAANTASTGGLFGAKPATTSTFGTGATSSLFGAKPTNTFGASNSLGGQEVLKGPNELQTYRADGPVPPPPPQGTANPAYYPTWQGDPSTSSSIAKEGPPHLFHSITGMLPYRGCSWEELRALDYQQGRKEATAPQQTNAFGASTGGFGQPAATGFGQQPAASTFGAPKPAGGLFGSTTGSTGFGSTSGGFGSTAANTGGSLFGQTQPATSSPFGQAPAASTGGLFGQPAQPQPNTGGGLFGNTNPFGGQTNQQQQPAAGSSTFGGFGQTKPAFGATGTTGFGATGTGTGTGTFGQTGTGSTGFGGFGQTQPQQQQQPATGGGLFGGGGFGSTAGQPQQNTGSGLFGQANTQQPATGAFGAAKPGGLFGSTTTPSTTGSTGFGGFGQTPAAQPAGTGLFGSTTGTNNTAGGLFGQTQPQQNAQQQPPAGGGLFGNTGSTGLFGAKPATTTPSTSLFGQTQPAQQPAQGSSLFGDTSTTGGGLFGSTNNSLGQQNQQQNQLGAKPAGGLFGGGGGLFGQQQQQQQQQQPGPIGGGLFGSIGQSQPASTGLFGSTAPQPQQQNHLGGSLFGGGLGQSTTQQQQQQQQQPSLTASIDQNPYGNNQLFAYNGQKLQYGSQTKKPALPPLTASSYRLTPTAKGKLNKLRGFASPLNGSQSPARGSTPLSGLNSPGRSSLLNSPVAPDRYKGLTDTALTPNAFVPRPSIKKLTVTPKTVSSTNGADPLESVLGKSALKGSTGSIAQPTPQRGAISSQSPASLFFNPPADGTVSRQPEVAESPVRRAAPLTEPSLRISGSERQPKKGEYWCKPKLEKLGQLGRQELSELHNFTAGRRGFGEVTFLESVDLTLAPLDDLLGTIVVFDQSELSVYPDDYSNKAPEGKGLNVPARITLENVFAHDKATKEPIRDPNDQRYARFLKRVKNIPNTEFVSYTDDGTWTFQVEHFSRYGIDESDEDDDTEEPRTAKSKATSDRTPLGTPDEDEDEDMLPPTKSIRDVEGAEHDSEIDEEDEDSYEEDTISHEHDDDDEARSDDLRSEPTAWDQPLKMKVGVEGMRKLREMQSSFFGGDRGASGLTTSVRKIGNDVHRNQKRNLDKNRLDSFFGEAGEDIVKLDERAVKRTSFGDHPISPPRLRQPRKYTRVAEDISIAKGGESVRVDAGLALGRSFRPSWGPNGELVHFGKICAPSERLSLEKDAVVCIEKIEALADEAKLEVSRAQRLLSLHLEHSLVETIDGVPYAAIDGAIRFRDFASRFDVGDKTHEASVFRLGVALFDEIDLHLPHGSSEDLTHRIASIRRKLTLSKWLEDAVAPAVDSDLIINSEDRPAKIFTLLSGHQVERAARSALDGGDMRLATLITQAGGEEAFRDEILKQLKDWDRYKVNGLINPGYRKLYALLAGITDISPGDSARGLDGCPDVFVADGLDWKRALGLRLWYGNPFDNTIGEVLASYTAALASSYPPAKPLPAYLERPANLPRSWNMPSEPTDVLYSLIKLYSDVTVSLDQVLRSRDISSSPFDVRLAWHLYFLLSKVLEKRDFEDRDEQEGYSASADRLTEGYAAQLEGLGEWRWAGFVLLHLETAEGREQALRALIFRHPEATSDDESFLAQTLRVPIEWIHESRAASLASSGNAWGEYQALLKAKLYDRAHRVLVQKLAPEAVIRDDISLLRRLCQGLEGKGVARWEFEGKLFLDWADLVQDTARLLASVLNAGSHPDPREAATLTDRARNLPKVLALLPGLFPNKQDVQQVASLSDMLSPLYQLGGALHSAGYIPRQAVPTYLIDEDRLHLLQGAAFELFNKSLDALPVAAQDPVGQY
ncbi:hypothetical protein IAR55_000558 [Kwoniella newhampshirensis]|uniref:Peptidase S59 domain-containing protein n=1 Tax=Kwoniella newhampshirensis TaxID=1651941 RepID=A0AAW0Z6X4_9TREE